MKKYTRNNIWKILKSRKFPVLLCFLGIFLEFFVFNYKHWESLLWTDEHAVLWDWSVGSGLGQTETGLFRVTAKDSGEETATIELLNINQELHNIHLNLSIENPASASDSAVNIQLKAKDDTSDSYFRLPVRDIVRGVPQTEYIRLHLCGETPELLLILNAPEGSLIRIHDISANVQVPFFFSAGRLAAVIFLLLAAYVLRPSSRFHDRLYVEHTWKGTLVVSVLIVLEILAAAAVSSSNLAAKETAGETYQQQYQLLAHSLAEGKTWLDIEPPSFLNELEDPYDYRARTGAQLEAGEDYLWDTAYYNGKYYVYFGIVPELVLYLPYYLITGNDLSTAAAVLILGSLFLIGVFALIGAIIRRWFRKTPFSVYLLISLFIANGSGVWTYFRNPGLYNVPVLAALACGVWGLYFWLKALEPERVNRLCMALGSLLIALIAGCRPTIIFVSVLAVPFFLPAIREKRLLNGQKLSGKLPDLLCFFAPVLIVAAGLMYYNAVRFGSVTDFGAAYNLTIQNMPEREFILGMIPMELFTMLLQPPVITGVFPYFQQVSVSTQYEGILLAEAGFGGVTATNLILCFSLMPFLFRRAHESREAYASAWLLTGAALVIIVADTQIGGIVPRYLVDFTWLLFLSTAFLLLGWSQRYRGTSLWKQGYTLFLVLFAQSMLFNGLTIFTDVYAKMEEFNPEVFYRAAHLIAFWT